MLEEHKNIVKYHNDLNELTFYKFGQVDFDFFMVLCSKFRDVDSEKISISFDEFRRLAGYSNKTSMERFINELRLMNYKQLISSGTIKRGNKIHQFVLFTEFEIDPDEKLISARVNKDYRYILSEVTKNFTRFELEEFVGLTSKYAKILYRLLKQFRMTGKYMVGVEDFKRIMMVPKSYTNMKIGQKILKPSVTMLAPYFKNLEYKVIRYENKPGRPVRGYEFSFVPEDVPKQIQKKPAQEKSKKSANRFHNFDQRTYDYDDLERKLRKAIQKNG